MTCDICNGESGGEYLGVACIPGAPMSVAWCRTCIENNAVPTFVFDHDFIYIANGDVMRLHEAARERVTWVDGAYVPFDEYVKRITPEQIIAAWDGYATSRGQEVGLD